MDFLHLRATDTSSSAPGVICVYYRERVRELALQMPATLQLWVHVYLEMEIARVLPNPDGGQKRKTEES